MPTQSLSLSRGRPAPVEPSPNGVRTYAVLPAHLGQAAWALYLDAFADLRVTAVQRHVMYRSEFDDVMNDTRVTKYVAFADGVICAISTRTTDLDAVPLVSPEYFAARYPQEYATHRIFYIGFMAVHPDYHGTGVFIDLVRDLSGDIAAVGGVAALDVCRVNNKNFKLPHAVLRLARWHSQDVRAVVLDEQSYWAYEFPPVD